MYFRCAWVDFAPVQLLSFLWCDWLTGWLAGFAPWSRIIWPLCKWSESGRAAKADRSRHVQIFEDEHMTIVVCCPRGTTGPGYFIQGQDRKCRSSHYKQRKEESCDFCGFHVPCWSINTTNSYCKMKENSFGFKIKCMKWENIFASIYYQRWRLTIRSVPVLWQCRSAVAAVIGIKPQMAKSTRGSARSYKVAQRTHVTRPGHTRIRNCCSRWGHLICLFWSYWVLSLVSALVVTLKAKIPSSAITTAGLVV